jgi:hypothetical protein
MQDDTPKVVAMAVSTVMTLVWQVMPFRVFIAYFSRNIVFLHCKLRISALYRMAACQNWEQVLTTFSIACSMI